MERASRSVTIPARCACRRWLRATTAAAAVENDLAKSLSTVETLLATRRADVMASFPTLTRHKADQRADAMGWLAPPRGRTAEPLMLLDRFVRLHDGPEEYGVSGRAD
jgi:hypothetical protein